MNKKDVVDGITLIVKEIGVKSYELFPEILDIVNKASEQYAMLYCMIGMGKYTHYDALGVYTPRIDYKDICGLVFRDNPNLIFSLQKAELKTKRFAFTETWEIPTAGEAQIWNDNLELIEKTLTELRLQDEDFNWRGETLYVCRKKS